MAEILAADHAEVDTILRGLLDAFETGSAREVLPKLDLLWARLAVHIRAEHLHLFPVLIAAAEGGGAAGAPVRSVEEALWALRDDHNFFMRELAACVEAVREMVAAGEPTGREELAAVRRRVLAVRNRLVEHNRREEEEVYRWPPALLSGIERDRLDAALRRELENLPPRFGEHGE
jgi:hypothetical protein